MWMLKAKRIEAWDHTAALIQLIVNALRQEGKRQISIEDVHPYRESKADQRHAFGHLRSQISVNGRSNQSG